MTAQAELTILLSVYNGAGWLPKQVDSILAQDYPSWKLIIRDDGSSDDSIAVIRNYAARYPEKIILHEDMAGNLGVKKSFSVLLAIADSPYIAFCDQDDIWYPFKLKRLVQELKSCEAARPPGSPLLVFSDLELIDGKDQTIDPSFIRYAGLSASFVRSTALLAKNVAPGCSMVFNKALARLAGEIPEEAVMHDYWLMLFAWACGEIRFLPEPLVRYRQHGANTLGAMRIYSNTWKTVFSNFYRYLHGQETHYIRYGAYRRQAQALMERLPSGNRRIPAINAFVRVQPATPRWKRKWLILRFRLRVGLFRENVEFLLCS
jgi:glycosyltransferase involved in cell wall biosynthesis